MRTWGRIIGPDGKKKWVVVETDENGFNDSVYITALIQVLKLNLNESPFYGKYGIPAHPAVIQQIFPDWYIWQVQRQFAPFFSSLIVSKIPAARPTYRVDITTNQGAKKQLEIAT